MAGIFITHQGTEIGSEDSDHPDVPDKLVVRKRVPSTRYHPEQTLEISLGHFTQKNIDMLIESLSRLRIHAEEDG